MWKPSLTALLLLAACDGIDFFGSDSPPPDPYPAISLSSATGKTYVPTGRTMVGFNGYDPVTLSPASIQVISSNQISMNGVLLTADSDGRTFRSSDGTKVVTVDSSIEGVSTDQILYMLASEQVFGSTYFTTYAMGNATAAADIPKSGTAVYQGKMTLVDDAGNLVTTDGPVLVLALATADVTGGVSFASRYVALTPTKMANGTFSTTLSSAEATPVVTGTIDGTLYGAGGKEVGGTLGLQYAPDGTPQTYVGYYGATTP